ncbi:hypothetical protein MAR_001733 [Mya arenaria]|uniref:EGF-like domain-containing protein n=1 Tax=Mya arenaria TaxID=6604 RepID=A0ABY7FCI0_MYAAR|nr:hypothetical protein MAR_001733 [Mya arenaria]
MIKSHVKPTSESDVEATSNLTFNYYATCPPGSCGRDLTPQHGQCLFGGCTCFLPWVGDTCSTELMTPTIIDQGYQQTVEESMKYSLQLNLIKGDPPVRWSLLEGPQDMIIDERTGMISWLHPLARSQSYQIRAQATNTIGSDTKSWELSVPFSYTAEVETSEPSGTLASPRPVQIQGRVLFSREDNHRMVPVDLEVIEVQTGRKVVIHEWSNPLSPQFFLARYYPRADDAGQFVAVSFVVFEDIYEDVYTLRAEAEDHASYSEVILASANKTQLDIFLQRIAVKYTWSVEPTTVQDVYIIQLESTFETYVPMPVVTIEPAKVNTIPYELEELDIINFNITNHGLIRADNTVDNIGSVAANTSIIVPVRATLKKRVKRNAVAAFVCGLAVFYDYICGGTQTRGLDVTLTREYPGRPPLPCELGNVGAIGGVEGDTGGSSRTGRGSAVSYNPTTPLSCNCAKTLIKSCALAFHPILGCGLAISDLASADSILGGMLAALDTAMACVFGVICSLCGLFYTALR